MFLLGILLGMLAMTFLIWKKCLFEKYGAYIPLDKNLDVQYVSKRKVLMSTKTFSVFRKMYEPLIRNLDMNYWIIHTGVEGYMYLLF